MHISELAHAAVLHGGLRFSVLGPLQAQAQGRALPLGPFKQRLVLATLLCHPNALVSVDMLFEAVWDNDPPRTARKNLHVYVSALRKMLAQVDAADRLELRPGGYLLQLAASELDLLQFQALARAGRQAASEGNAERAAQLLSRARTLWNGTPLPELASSDALRAEAARLTARHLALSEDWAEAALRAGQFREVAEATADLVELHPLRERLRASQMTALHRSGRRSEAMAVYDELRQHLSRELGLSPNSTLESAYRSILADDPSPAGPDTVHRTPPPAHIPTLTADFTGCRGPLTALLESATTGATLSIVVGPAGAGKSALAVQAAHRLKDEFPDGRIFVRLCGDDGTPRPLASVTAELLAGTDVPPDAVPGDPERAAAVWRAWLADRRVLLVLDDAPDESAVRPLLPGMGQTSVIVTARAQLAGLAPAQRISVPPLSTAEALELLGRLIGPGRVLCDQPAAERIVVACGSLPLTVRAAGLKLAVLRHLPLADYADRLSDPGAVLDELVVGDVDVRSQAAGEWRHLGESRRFTLGRLARLPLAQTFTVEEASGVLACGQDEARRELERMIEAGVVVSPRSEVATHSAAYSLPYLTHLYARQASSDDLIARQL